MPQIPGTALTKNVHYDEQHCRRAPITKDDLIGELQSVQCKHPDAQITYKLYKSNGGSYHIETFRSHFGSWAKAVEAVGSVPGHARYTNDELFDEIQRLWEHFGRQPTFSEMQKNGKINPHTYHKRFGSWLKAIHAFCEDRNSDSVDEEAPPVPPELPSSDDRQSQSGTKEFSDNVPSAEPAPLIIVRKTGRTVPKRLRFRVLVHDEFTCQACGRSPKKHGIEIEADHVIPYTKGGETVFENLQTLCQDCNNGKSNLWTV